MKNILFFKDITKKDAKKAGGKGASLGEMTQARLPVPPGFVILASAFDQFLEKTDLNVEISSLLKKVKHEDMNSIEKASEAIQALIHLADMPNDLKKECILAYKQLKSPFVAVRSSATAEDGATAAWAGQLDTYLNTTEKTLAGHVKKCWASLFTPRAIFYRFEKKMHKEHISVAVIVQKMVQSQVAGVAFSVHPVTQDRNQMIIEAGWGLGEAVVSGQVTPDSYVIEKKSGLILDVNVSGQGRELIKGPNGTVWKKIPESRGGKQKLTGKAILELAGLVERIERHYGFPCDIEWAFEKKIFYITQSRPITTLTSYAK